MAKKQDTFGLLRAVDRCSFTGDGSRLRDVTVRAVLGQLVRRCPPGGLHVCAVAALASSCGLSLSSVFRALALLEAQGLIQRVPQARDGMTQASGFRVIASAIWAKARGAYAALSAKVSAAYALRKQRIAAFRAKKPNDFGYVTATDTIRRAFVKETRADTGLQVSDAWRVVMGRETTGAALAHAANLLVKLGQAATVGEIYQMRGQCDG